MVADQKQFVRFRLAFAMFPVAETRIRDAGSNSHVMRSASVFVQQFLEPLVERIGLQL